MRQAQRQLLAAAQTGTYDSGRFGVQANQASIDVDFTYSHVALAKGDGDAFSVVFSAQHGMWGKVKSDLQYD